MVVRKDFLRWLSRSLILGLGLMLAETAWRPASAQQFLADSHNGRNYRLFVPAGAGAQPLPLVVMLHGCTQDPDIFAQDTEMNELGAAKTFLVLYPDQPETANQRKCWNWFEPAHQARGRGEPAEIVAIVERVRGQFQVDPNRIYVAGLSAGAAMSVVMGVTYPDVFASIGVAAGLPYRIATNVGEAVSAMSRPGTSMPGLPGGVGTGAFGPLLEAMLRFQLEFWRNLWFPGLDPIDLPVGTVLAGTRDPDILGEFAFEAMGGQRRVIPVIVFHGTADSLVRSVNGDEVISQWAQTDDLASDGTDNDNIDDVPEDVQRGSVPAGRTFTESTYHDGTGAIVMKKVIVEGMGHAWSGGSPTGSSSPLAGPLTDPRGPDASQLIWEFFEAHPKNAI
jgi:poly(hydroxyalkanoate) depolymerase family esterase